MRAPENDPTVVSGFKSLVCAPFNNKLPTKSLDCWMRFFGSYVKLIVLWLKLSSWDLKWGNCFLDLDVWSFKTYCIFLYLGSVDG